MKTRLISLSACAVLLAAPLSGLAKSKEAAAPDRTEQKIRMMAEVLAARDKGNYQGALATLEEILRLSPNDPQLLTLQASLRQALENPPVPSRPAAPVILPEPRSEADFASHSQPPSTPVRPESSAPPSQPPPSPSDALLIRPRALTGSGPTDIPALVAAETDRQTFYLEKARHDLWYVRRLGDEGRHAEALSQLASVGTELPTNPRTLSVLQEIAATRVDLEHRLRVASLNPGAEPPRLALVKDDIASVAKSSDPLSKKPVIMELHLLELSGDLIEDFWTAWRFFSESIEAPGPTRIHQSLMARTSSLHRPGRTPTKRQQALLWAFRLAAPRVFESTPLPERDRSLGFVAFLDAGVIVRALSSMKGCQVLGSPTWDSFAGQGAQLTLTPEQHLPVSDASAPADVGWQIRVSPLLKDEGRSVQLDLHPKLTRYAGFVPASDSSAKGNGTRLSAVYSTHELQTRIDAPLGATLVLTGLEWQQAPTKAPAPGSISHMPLVGDVLRAREFIAERSELLLFMTTRAAP